MLTLLLLACTGAPEPDDTAAGRCEATVGTLRVCVWMQEGDTAALPGVKAWVAVDDDEAGAIETRTGADGCAEFALEAGEWWAWGEDDTQNCRSWPTAVTVNTCEVTTYDTYVYMGCLDG